MLWARCGECFVWPNHQTVLIIFIFFNLFIPILNQNFNFLECKFKRPLRVVCTTALLLSFLLNCVYTNSLKSIFTASHYEASYKNICEYLKNDYKIIHLQDLYYRPLLKVNLMQILFFVNI